MSFQPGDTVYARGESGAFTVAKVSGQRVQLELPNGRKIWREKQVLRTDPHGSPAPAARSSRSKGGDGGGGGGFVPPVASRGAKAGGGAGKATARVTESDSAQAIFQGLGLAKTPKSRFEDSILVLKQASSFDLRVRGGETALVNDTVRLYTFAKGILEKFLASGKSSEDTAAKLTAKCKQVEKRIASLHKKVTDRPALVAAIVLDQRVWSSETRPPVPVIAAAPPAVVPLGSTQPSTPREQVKSPDVKQTHGAPMTPRADIPKGLVSMRKNSVGMLRRDSGGSEGRASRLIEVEDVVSVLKIESGARTADQVDLVATWVTQAKVGFFQSLSSASVRLRVCEQLQLLTEEEGVTVVEQGAAAGVFYIILQGEVRTVIAGEDEEILGVGESFGEETLTCAKGDIFQYDATIITDDPAVAFATLDRDVYESLSAEQDHGLSLLRSKNIVGSRAGMAARRLHESTMLSETDSDNPNPSRLEGRNEGVGGSQRKMSVSGGLGRRASIGSKMLSLTSVDLDEMRHQASILLALPDEERTDLALVQLADWINTVKFFQVSASIGQNSFAERSMLTLACCRITYIAMTCGLRSAGTFSCTDSKKGPPYSDRCAAIPLLADNVPLC